MPKLLIHLMHIQLLLARGSVPYGCKYSIIAPHFHKWSYYSGLLHITVNLTL